MNPIAGYLFKGAKLAVGASKMAALGKAAGGVEAFASLAGSAKKTDVFYRAMSNAEHASLVANNGLSSMAGKELFVSTAERYSSKFLDREGYDVLVQFNMRGSNTLKELSKNGLKHSDLVEKFGFKYLPPSYTGWMKDGKFLFKVEDRVLNIGLGNPATFNSRIESFKIIK